MQMFEKKCSVKPVLNIFMPISWDLNKSSLAFQMAQYFHHLLA